MTQEQWIEEALAAARGDTPADDRRRAECLSHLDLDGLHEYNLRRLAEARFAGGPSAAIRDRPFVRQDRPAKQRETS